MKKQSRRHRHNLYMPNFIAERKFQRQGHLRVAGLDEVGRGAWAGPLVAGAVILPEPTRALRKCLATVDDSKLLRPEPREECAVVIREHALACGIGVVSVVEIDAFGMSVATQQAMHRALTALRVQPQALLIDAFLLRASALPQRAIIHGDSYSFSVAAASIIAKVTRDAIMRELAEQYPQYHFDSNKGYGTPAHQSALKQFGPLPLHRHSFSPIMALADELMDSA